MKNKAIKPIPQGTYLPAVRHANVIYTSGMTPRKAGTLIYEGKILASKPLSIYKEAVRLATLNALVAAEECLKGDEKISLILQLNVFINADQEFTAHAKIGDYASELLIERLGNSCIGTRAAIGVATLPSNAPIEITLVGKVI